MNIYESFIEELKNESFFGDIENEISQRLSQSTDNSIYQIIPDVILYPKSEQDITKVFKVANLPEYRDIIFTARGGFTGTNGQSLNKGIIIDCSRYFNNIRELNLTPEDREDKWVEVEPGVTLRELNEFLAPYDYHFAPNISPDDRATIGGMIATDASGKGSYIYGKTSDHLIEVTALLINQGKYIFKHYQHDNITDHIAHHINNIVKQNSDKICQAFPRHKRFATGYNLDKLTGKDFNLNYLIAGSEGSLGVITKARLKIKPILKHQALIITHYRDFNECLKDASNLLKFKPLAIETMDETLLSLSKTHPLYQDIEKYLKDAKHNAINIIEFKAETKKALDVLTSNFLKNYQQKSLCYNAVKVSLENDIKKVWELRGLAVGIAGNMQGNKKPIAFIEDVAIPPENLVDYVADLKNILQSYKLKYVLYGHIDVGCLHVRPSLDLRVIDQQKLIPEITQKIIKLVKKHQGVIWGEHGSGLRASFSEEFFGKEICALFSEIKQIFDPGNRLNPGKISVPSNSNGKFQNVTDNLHANQTKKITANLALKFNNLLSCNGNTKCLTVDDNQVMCPSWKVTKEKIHSPKGRSNLIEDWLVFRSLHKIPKKLLSRIIFRQKHKNYLMQILRSLNGCLNCNACSSSCPVRVDIPFHKTMFLEWYHKLYLRRPREYLLAKIEIIIAICAKYPRIFNFLLQNRLSKFLSLRIFALTSIPKLTNFYYQKNIQKRIFNPKKTLPKNTVFLIADSFNVFLKAESFKHSIKLLQYLNFNVQIIPNFNSGKSLLNLGFLGEFKKVASRNICDLNQISSYGFPIITIEPIMALLFNREYKKCFSGKTEINYKKIELISEFLNQNLELFKVKNNFKKDIYCLSHCSEKTCMPEQLTYWKNIFSAININFTHLESGCCGMAGNYGYEKEHLLSSKALFDLTWKTHLESYPKSQICVTGFSCREQVERFQNDEVAHPVTLLYELFYK